MQKWEELANVCPVGEQVPVLYFPVTSHLLHAALPVTLGHPPTHRAGERSLITTRSSRWIDCHISCQMGKSALGEEEI